MNNAFRSPYFQSRFAWAGLLACLSFSAPLQAQVYRCEIAGKVEYQQQPCAAVANSAAKLVASSTDKPDLWTSALKQGMSLEAVRKVVPQARTGQNNTLKNGARELLRVENVVVAAQTFNAEFYFLNEKFLRVNFSGPMNVSNEENKRSFEKLTEIFRSRYGAPSDHKLNQSFRGLSASADWNIAQGEVWMIVVPITASTSLVNFGFVPTAR